MPPPLEGRLRLAFELVPGLGRTVVSVREQRSPLQVVRAFPQADGAALVHLHNLSGGVLGGDDLTLEAEVGPAAAAQLTSTGATRLYRPRAADPPACQSTSVRIAEGGLLEFLPDPLIPYAGARYRQRTRIDLSPGAGLFWWEAVAPGRAARGEQFAYDWLHLTLDLWAGGRPLALERIRLEPGRPAASWARLGPYLYFATFYVCRLGLEAPAWLQVERELDMLAAQWTEPGEVLWAASALPAHGVVVRALACSSRRLHAGLLAFWSKAKKMLYGRDPIPPRKVL